MKRAFPRASGAKRRTSRRNVALALFLAVCRGYGETAPQWIPIQIGGETHQIFMDVNSVAATPEQLEKAKGLISDAAERQRGRWSEEMTAEVLQVRAAAELTARQMEDLKGPAQEAIARSVEIWSARTGPILATLAGSFGEERKLSVPNLEQSIPAIGAWPGEPPYEQPLWTEALQKTLTPGQRESWKRVDEERRRRGSADATAKIRPLIANRSRNLEKPIPDNIAELKRELSLSPARAAELQEQTLALARRHVVEWDKELEKVIAAAGPRPKISLPVMNALLSSAEAKAPPTNAALRKETCDTLLSPAEQRLLHGLATDRLLRRKQSIARFVLIELDEKVRFSEQQREHLIPLAMRLIQQALPGEEANAPGISRLRETMDRATDDDLKTILDERQRTSWHSACQPPDYREEPLAPGDSSEVDDEREISGYFLGKTEYEKKALLQRMLATVDDATRVIPLSTIRAQRLETAARAAVEQVLGNLRVSLEQKIRPRLLPYHGQSAQTRHTELVRLPKLLVTAPACAAEETLRWKNAVHELSPTEQEKVRHEARKRSAFREANAAEMVVQELDKTVPISSDQRHNLEPLVEKVIREFLAELEEFRVFGDGVGWLRDPNRRFVPLMAIQAELKAGLEPDQWTSWTEQIDLEQADAQWAHVKSLHAERLALEASYRAGAATP